MALRAARVFLLLSLSLPVPAMAAKPVMGGGSGGSGNIYCCNDERGKQVCGDLLPAACAGRAHREISPSGLIVRNVEAPLTPEQREQREQEERRRKQVEAAAREQKRLDDALLQTYGSEADIELMRKRAEAELVKAIQIAAEKIDDTKKRRVKFENEAEFYKKRQMPPDVEKGLKEADFEIRAQEELIASKQKEMGLIKAKYDEDLRRFRDLKSRLRAR